MKRWVLKCDLFRVVQDTDKHLTPPNRYGALMTLVMYVVVAVLVLSECIEYYRGHRQCSLAPSGKLSNLTEAEADRLYQIHALVTFPYIPCRRLGGEILDDEWRVPSVVAGRMRVTRYPTNYGESQPNLETLPFFHEDQPDGDRPMGCTIRITSPLPVYPVQFNIIVAGYDSSKPLEFRPDHAIHELRLGGQDISGLLPQVTKQTTEPLSKTNRALMAPPTSPSFFLFYVQYLQTQMTRHKQPTVSGFQYTAQESYVYYSGRGTAPGLYIRLLPSPYSILCTLSYDTISHFLVNLCAVVGGVYTVFGFIELGLETLTKLRKQEERAYQNALNTEKAQRQKVVDQYLRTL